METIVLEIDPELKKEIIYWLGVLQGGYLIPKYMEKEFTQVQIIIKKLREN